MKNRLQYLYIFMAWLSVRAYVYFYNWQYFSADNADDSTFHMWYLPPDYIATDNSRHIDQAVWLAIHNTSRLHASFNCRTGKCVSDAEHTHALCIRRKACNRYRYIMVYLSSQSWR